MSELQLIEDTLRSNAESLAKTSSFVNLYIAYYKDNDPEREKEINMCLKLNCQNKNFSKIYVFSEVGADIPFLPIDERIVIITNEKRMKFCDFFSYSNKYTEENSLNVLINSDIVIGEGIEKLSLEPNQAICLTRYDISEKHLDGVINVGGGSHDCWIWRGKMKENIGNYYMGKYHCDGVLAGELDSSGYILKNPVYGLKAYHVHLTNVRNYTTDYKVQGLRNGVSFSKNDGIFLKEDTYYDGYTS